MVFHFPLERNARGSLGERRNRRQKNVCGIWQVKSQVKPILPLCRWTAIHFTDYNFEEDGFQMRNKPSPLYWISEKLRILIQRACANSLEMSLKSLPKSVLTFDGLSLSNKDPSVQPDAAWDSAPVVPIFSHQKKDPRDALPWNCFQPEN